MAIYRSRICFNRGLPVGYDGEMRPVKLGLGWWVDNREPGALMAEQARIKVFFRRQWEKSVRI